MEKMDVRKLNLYQKILEIGKMCGVLKKDKSGYGFKYTGEDSIQAPLTAGLQKYGVLLVHNITPGTFTVTPHTYEKFDTKIKEKKQVTEFIISAETTYDWINVDNPAETIHGTYCMVGMQEDPSQAFGSAETYCNRYYLMKALQMATTEDDPDNWRSKQKEAADREENELAKEKAAELKAKVDQVVAIGTNLIKSGINKEDMLAVIAQYNNGNKNPASIKTTETADEIITALEKMKK